MEGENFWVQMVFLKTWSFEYVSMITRFRINQQRAIMIFCLILKVLIHYLIKMALQSPEQAVLKMFSLNHRKETWNLQAQGIGGLESVNLQLIIQIETRLLEAMIEAVDIIDTEGFDWLEFDQD